MNTLLAILLHTPLWVWALLALILAVGQRQARGVQQRLWRLLCLPLAWLLFGAFSIAHGAGWLSLGMLAWLLGLGAGILLALGLRWGRLARYEPHTRLYHVPGSWLPLGLMLGIFGLRYLSAVFAALHPMAAGPWVPLMDGLFGTLTGALLGRLAGILYSTAPTAPASHRPLNHA